MLARSQFLLKNKRLDLKPEFKLAQLQWQGAKELAAKGHFELATSVLLSANKSLRRVLSDVGVWVPV